MQNSDSKLSYKEDWIGSELQCPPILNGDIIRWIPTSSGSKILTISWLGLFIPNTEKLKGIGSGINCWISSLNEQYGWWEKVFSGISGDNAPFTRAEFN